MRIYIVTADIDDRENIPCYGSFVSVMGVYATREQADKRMRNLQVIASRPQTSRISSLLDTLTRAHPSTVRS